MTILRGPVYNDDDVEYEAVIGKNAYDPPIIFKPKYSREVIDGKEVIRASQPYLSNGLININAQFGASLFIEEISEGRVAYDLQRDEYLINNQVISGEDIKRSPCRSSIINAINNTNNNNNNKENKMSKAEELRKLLDAELKKEAAIFAKFGAEPKTGAVITFKVQYEKGGIKYTWFAGKAAGKWYTTAFYDNNRVHTWESLTEFLTGPKVYKVTKFKVAFND